MRLELGQGFVVEPKCSAYPAIETCEPLSSVRKACVLRMIPIVPLPDGSCAINEPGTVKLPSSVTRQLIEP